MRRRILSTLAALLFTFPAGVSAFELGVGPDVGWSVRQVALVPSSGSQVDLFSHYVTFGVTGDAEVVDDLLSFRLRAALDMMEHMEINGVPQPGTFSQHSVTAESLMVFAFDFTDVIAGTIGTGASFTRYLPSEIRGSRPEDVQGVADQQVMQIPLMFGTRIKLDEVTLLPELGLGYALYYDSTAPDVSNGLSDGSVDARNLDVWVRVGVSFPVL